MSAADATGTEQAAALNPVTQSDPWQPFHELPLRLTIDIALPAMSLRALSRLCAGQQMRSATPASDDLPVVVGGALLGWARFECVDDRMLMRVTRLA